MTQRYPLIFLDIGGHLGQTLDEVLSGCYAFDHIHTFEPMPSFADLLRTKYRNRIDEGRLTVHACGLSNRDGEVTLYGDNDSGGASVHAAKESDGQAETTTVKMCRTTSFFTEHIKANDRVIMKLNCEGAEGQILLDLIESGLIHRITDVMIDFDLFKVKGRRHEPFEILKRLGDVGFSDYHLAGDVMVGPTHQDRIRNWLAHVNARTPIARVPDVFDGLPLKRRLSKRLLRAAKHRAMGWFDASPLGRAG